MGFFHEFWRQAKLPFVEFHNGWWSGVRAVVRSTGFVFTVMTIGLISSSGALILHAKIRTSPDMAAGFFGGVFLTALLLGAIAAAPRLKSRLWSTTTALARTMTELLLISLFITTLLPLFVFLLPDIVTDALDRRGGMVALTTAAISAIGVALIIRAWGRYAHQVRIASAADLEIARSEAAIAERDRMLSEAQLMLVRAQVEPHFLWNTLSLVEYHAKRNPTDAVRATQLLTRYLRRALENVRVKEFTLGMEIDGVAEYLELMEMRMGGRLSTTIQRDAELTDMAFPPLLLQTLVENAVKHGIEPKVGPVSITVTTRIDRGERDVVMLEVRDNGVGEQQRSSTKGTGLGLSSVRERLSQMYGVEASLVTSSLPTEGFISRITIPLSSVSYRKSDV